MFFAVAIDGGSSSRSFDDARNSRWRDDADNQLS